MNESKYTRTKKLKDQAHSLRMISTQKEMQKATAVTRVMSFTSGKGGVGKTNSVVNLALSLAERGRSVLILDADLGLANVDVMLGLKTKYTLHDVIEGRRTLNEVIVSGPSGISVIPAASGVESICNLACHERLGLLQAVEEIASQYDYLLIDTCAGIGQDVMHFNSAAGEIVCVITAEPTSLTDAYAMIKVLARNYNEKSISILANNIQATSRTASDEASRAYRRLQLSVERFLSAEQVELKYLGFIPAETAVNEAIRNQRSVVELFPSSAAARAFTEIANKIDLEFSDYRIKGGMQFFFKQLMEVGTYGS